MKTRMQRNLTLSQVVMSGDYTRLQLGINQPLGTVLSENRCKKGIKTVTKSGCGEHELSEMKYNP